MPHPRTAAKPRRRSEGGFLLGIFVGVVLGLAVELGIAFYLNKSPMPFQTAKPTKSDKDGGKAPASAGLPQGSSVPHLPEKPKFDLYSIMAKEEPVTEKELRDKARTARGQQEISKDVYFIQAGSFQKPADADNQKAKRASPRFEASAQPADL